MNVKVNTPIINNSRDIPAMNVYTKLDEYIFIYIRVIVWTILDVLIVSQMDEHMRQTIPVGILYCLPLDTRCKVCILLENCMFFTQECVYVRAYIHIYIFTYNKKSQQENRRQMVIPLGLAIVEFSTKR